MKYIIKGIQQGFEYYAIGFIVDSNGNKRLEMSDNKYEIKESVLEFNTEDEAYKEIRNEYEVMLKCDIVDFMNWVDCTMFEVIEKQEEN